jgi:transcription antitermination factor NusG
VPGAVKFVHFSGNHATVREEVLDMIKRIVETGVAIETDGSDIEPGEKVKVIGGPLQHMIGEVIERGNKDYFMIRIPGIYQNILISLPRKFLEVTA